MANFRFSSQFMRLNHWTKEKTVFICKITSLAACMVGTLSYYSPLEPYLEVPCFGILVPTFIIGYLIIICIELLVYFTENEYILIEICFNVGGVIGSLVCGLYELYKWIAWIINAANDPDKDYNLSEFALAMALLVHSVAMAIVVVHYIQEYKLLSPRQEDPRSS